MIDMDEGGGNEVKGNESSFRSWLLVEGIKGFFWSPHGIQIGIGLTIIIVSKVMGYW